MASEILMLNDHCFLELFKHLTLHDLANFKEAYGCLSAVADMAFTSATCGQLYFRREEKIDEKLQIIKQFGSSVNDLTFDLNSLQGHKWGDIFSAISKHCKTNLKSLALYGAAVKLMKEADTLLIADILKNIETIEVESNRYSNREYYNTLSHCEKATSTVLHLPFVIDLHKAIFQNNKNLLKLCISINSTHLRTIVNNLMNTRLEGLNIYLWNSPYNSSDCIWQLRRLNYLKRLTIRGRYLDIGHFLRNLDDFNSLNALHIHDARLHESHIETLTRITRLKVLRISCDLDTNSHFESLLVLCGNKNFEHLLLSINLIDFDSIDELNFLRIVKKRKAYQAENCLRLTLHREIYIASLKAITSELLEANKETIKLIDEWDWSYECNGYDDHWESI